MLTPEEELMSRKGCDDLDVDYPALSPAEHRWIEDRVGRLLTNEEAQLAIREATIRAAYERWIGGRRVSL